MVSFDFTNKNILLGVSGSIAAYKACELLRMFQTSGADTRVIMTEQAIRFVSPLTFQALSGFEVHSRLVDYEEEKAMGHINLARWADVLIIAPASAALLSRLAVGDAADLLSAVFLATTAPRIIAPAMNKEMWTKNATQENIRNLGKSSQTHMVQPTAGWQACGEIGEGRLADLGDIMVQAAARFATGSLAGKRILITAGPTQEPLDAMRYITNRSSGKMGYALAKAAIEAGAKTTLISGPVSLPSPDQCEFVPVRTAQDMLGACEKHIEGADVFIAAAAVADVKPTHYSKNKIPKEKMLETLGFAMNEDILMRIKEIKSLHTRLVGFAAETDNMEERGWQKLREKGLDMICVNDIQTAVGRDENEILLLFADGRKEQLENARKAVVARQIMEKVSQLCASS